MRETMAELRCDTCRYWDESVEECHIGPPTIHPDNLRGVWPGTVAADWCGEWEGRTALPIVPKSVSGSGEKPKKPPLGVLPLNLWQESNPNPDVATRAQRAIEVAQAVQRYYEAGELVNPEWLSEIGIRGLRPGRKPFSPEGPHTQHPRVGQESPEGK